MEMKRLRGRRIGQTAPVAFDWADGDYGRTAAQLAPAAEVLLDAAGVGPGHAVADIACGTGNVALAAVRRGAAATGVDASERLVAQARERAAAEGVAARFLVGDAMDLPLPEAGVDAALSAFGVIFAPDSGRALAEMVRVTRPGGVVALTSWLPGGAVAAAGRLLVDALWPGGDAPRPRWDDVGWVTARLAEAGGRDAGAATAEMSFTAHSPEAWLAEHEEHHPAWRAGPRELGPDRWRELRGAMLAGLRDGNEDPAAFRATSGYLVVTARR
jgi:SAM-dependent methyltransferase